MHNQTNIPCYSLRKKTSSAELGCGYRAFDLACWVILTPFHPLPLPPEPPLLLNSAFQRMCAYSADLNFRLSARHTKQPRPTLPPVPPFSNAQECLCALLFLGLTRPAGANHERFTQPAYIHLPLLIVFPLPLKAKKLCMHVVKILCYFYKHQLLCGSEPSLLTQKCGCTLQEQHLRGSGNTLPYM